MTSDIDPGIVARMKDYLITADNIAFAARVAQDLVDEAVTVEQTKWIEFLSGVDPEKLRWLANYIDECDSIVGKVLDWADAWPFEDAKEMVAGKSAQEDLLIWADKIDALLPNHDWPDT